jgi:hypothetical protein
MNSSLTNIEQPTNAQPDSSRSKRDAPVQTLSDITEWASQDFLRDFETLPGAADLVFERLAKTEDLKLYHTKSRFSRPREATPHLLRVGHFNDNLNLSPGARVAFAFIHFGTSYFGRTGLTVEYVYKARSESYVQLNTALHHIHLEAPFNKMTNSNGTPDWDLVKALVCWYFITMGHLDKIENYENFKDKFKSVCAMMKRKSENLVPTPKEPPIATGAQHGKQGSPDLTDHRTGDLERAQGVHGM